MSENPLNEDAITLYVCTELVRGAAYPGQDDVYVGTIYLEIPGPHAHRTRIAEVPEDIERLDRYAAIERLLYKTLDHLKLWREE